MNRCQTHRLLLVYYRARVKIKQITFSWVLDLEITKDKKLLYLLRAPTSICGWTKDKIQFLYINIGAQDVCSAQYSCMHNSINLDLHHLLTLIGARYDLVHY